MGQFFLEHCYIPSTSRTILYQSNRSSCKIGEGSGLLIFKTKAHHYYPVLFQLSLIELWLLCEEVKQFPIITLQGNRLHSTLCCTTVVAILRSSGSLDMCFDSVFRYLHNYFQHPTSMSQRGSGDFRRHPLVMTSIRCSSLKVIDILYH